MKVCFSTSQYIFLEEYPKQKSVFLLFVPKKEISFRLKFSKAAP